MGVAPRTPRPAPGPSACRADEFRRQLRDLYVPGDDVGFWQGAIRDRDDAEYADLLDVVRSPRVFAIELLYSDHEGASARSGASLWLR